MASVRLTSTHRNCDGAHLPLVPRGRPDLTLSRPRPGWWHLTSGLRRKAKQVTVRLHNMTDGPPQILKLYNIRGYDVAFLRDFRRYPYAMTICQSGKQDPIAVVTVERNRMARLLKTGSHFLCLHDGDRHINYGASNDWVNADKFEEAALKTINSWIDGQ